MTAEGGCVTLHSPLLPLSPHNHHQTRFISFGCEHGDAGRGGGWGGLPGSTPAVTSQAVYLAALSSWEICNRIRRKQHCLWLRWGVVSAIGFRFLSTDGFSPVVCSYLDKHPPPFLCVAQPHLQTCSWQLFHRCVSLHITGVVFLQREGGIRLVSG